MDNLPLSRDALLDEIRTLHETVSDRNARINELEQRNELFRQLGDSVDHVIWVTEWPAHEVAYVSPAYEKVWGRVPERLYENPIDWVRAIHPDDRERVERAFMEQIESGRYDEEYRVVRPDASIRWVRDRGFPVKDARGRVYRVAGIAEDITRQKELESEFARHSENLERLFLERDVASKSIEPWARLIYDSSTDFYLTLSADGRLVDLNRSAVEALGHERSELVGAKLEGFAEPASRPAIRAFLAGIERPDSAAAEEWSFVTPDGSGLELRFRGASRRTTAQGDERLYVVLRDVTRSRRLQRHLVQAEKLATTGRLAASVAHEINNPLQAVQLHLSIVAQSLPVDFGEADSWGRIEEGIARISHVVNDLLDLHRVGRRAPQDVELNVLVQEALGLAAGRFRANRIRVVQQLQPGLPEVHGISHQLYQVILNLLINGAEALGPESTLLVRTSSDQGQVLIEVEDDGPGIPAAELHRIFDPLYTSRETKSAGLGLFVSRTLVQEHGGTLQVTSVDGRGTRVTVRLPAADGSNVRRP